MSTDLGRNLGYSAPPFPGKCVPLCDYDCGPAPGGLPVYHGSQKADAVEGEEDAEDVVIQDHPAKSEDVKRRDNCLHLGDL